MTTSERIDKRYRNMKKNKKRTLRKTRRTVPRQEQQQVVTKLVKRVGKNSDNLGRIYLPGHWIGKKVKLALLE
jgi:hypothetical protein